MDPIDRQISRIEAQELISVIGPKVQASVLDYTRSWDWSVIESRKGKVNL